jgi:hypothetical protein
MSSLVVSDISSPNQPEMDSLKFCRERVPDLGCERAGARSHPKSGLLPRNTLKKPKKMKIIDIAKHTGKQYLLQAPICPQV